MNLHVSDPYFCSSSSILWCWLALYVKLQWYRVGNMTVWVCPKIYIYLYFNQMRCSLSLKRPRRWLIGPSTGYTRYRVNTDWSGGNISTFYRQMNTNFGLLYWHTRERKRSLWTRQHDCTSDTSRSSFKGKMKCAGRPNHLNATNTQFYLSKKKKLCQVPRIK